MMQHFYVHENLSLDQKIVLTKEQQHQCLHVLRYKNHQVLMLIGKNNVKALAELICENEQCSFKLTEIIENPFKNKQIRLVIALIKKDRFEWMLQKATELGATEIIPLITERTQLNEHLNFEKKLDRYQKIITEACEQSEQFHLCHLNLPIKLKDINAYKTKINYLAFEREKSVSLKSAFQTSDSYTLMIGPEGGFTESELMFLKNNGFISVSLGNHIYRTETAAIVFLSQINCLVNP